MRRVARLGHCHFFSVNASRCCCSSCRGRHDVGSVTRHSCVPTLGTVRRVVRGDNRCFGITFSLSNINVRRLRLRTPRILRGLRRLGRANYMRFLTRPCSRNLSSLIGRRAFGSRIGHRYAGVRRCFNGGPAILHGSSLVCDSRVNTAMTSVSFINVLARNTGRILN